MSGKKKKGIVVDVRDPRKAMIEAGWGGSKPDKRKRKAPPSWIDQVRKMFS